MGTPYSGADSFPETVTLPADNVEARNASSVNVPIQGLADRLRWAQLRAMTFVAFNWTKGGATSNPLRRGCYSPKESSWYAVGPGGSNFLEVSRDGGREWENIGGNVPGTPTLCDVAVDTAGNVVLVSSASAVVKVGTLGGVWRPRRPSRCSRAAAAFSS